MHRHFIIHKPYGYLSQFIGNPQEQKKKLLLGELYDFPGNTMAVGRLDEDSEGLLFLTTDGKLSDYIRGRHIEKEYYAQVDGSIDDEAIEKLKQGVEIGVYNVKYITSPCKASRLDVPPAFPERSRRIRGDWHGPTSWVSITINEGKFRQVRKMTAAVGFPTLRLIRVRIGNEQLGSLKSGETREVTNFSV